MEKEKTFVINHLVDLTEDASYTLVDSLTFENKATLVIKNEKMTVYYEDGSEPTEFEDDYESLLDLLQDNEWLSVKLMDGNHRWKKYNPNPQSKNIGDCTLRSYCAAFNITWEEAFDIASNIAKENASMIQYVSDKVLKEYFECVEDETYNKKTVKAKDRITVNEFAMSHPYGTYILHTRSHQVTVRNGEYWDSWDSGNKKIDVVYLITKK